MLSARPDLWNEPLTQVVARRQIGRLSQLVFIYFSWQLLQAARNCPISLLNSSRRLALLASWANFEAVEARVEIRKVHPEVRRGVRIGRRIAIGAWLPLIGSRRKHVRKRHQHDRNGVGVLTRLCGVELAIRRQHRLDLIHHYCAPAVSTSD